jgi:NAD-dependent DNA ligase
MGRSDPLTGKTIGCAGDFEYQKRESEIKKWVENNGGTFAINVDGLLDYLVCTEVAYTKDDPKGAI